ncbi:phage resistance protein [Achromobacter xylosoxidans]|uniref:EAL domain-containing protein n=1 Tax=Alcaligenes xylosoxydans xylosoxydans TaxID=85698 RepID=UPI0006C0ACD6|nr:phage resistance protein [Achromobacter xylosoxidans]CUJ21557.1 phage resistance protein [Achromobacter xylosoxidans]CUJ93570.1 phage resistance protein [Achromobacter xylosoxidans]
MPTSGMTVRVPSWRYFPVALALVLPVLGCIGWTWLHALSTERAEAATAGRIVRVQTGQIMARALDILPRVTALSEQSCQTARPDLYRWGTLNPYFRSLLLVKREHIYCSSALGEVDYETGAFHRWPVGTPPTQWFVSVSGTPLAPDRPALLLGMAGEDGRGGVVVVDGRYVQDLLNAVSSLGAYQLEVTLGRGAPIRNDAWGTAAAESLFESTEAVAGRGDLVIRVMAPSETVVRAWQQLLVTYLPVAMLCGALLAFGAYRLQVNRQSFKEQLRRAMDADELHVEYQPVYGKATGRCEGAEALMRWTRPGVGPVRPDIFIAAAEAENMIVPLTQHLLKLIQRDMQAWNTPPDFHIAVNVAPEHLSSPALVADIQAFRGAIRPSLMVLEITERSLISDNGQARRNIDALRAQGVFVAIDDFGTGHCSLSYLQMFPVDYLKIDKGFVQAIQDNGEEAPVLDVIITLSHRLGLAVVAEGVETPGQFTYLTERGVAFIQGYLFARPMRSADFVRWYADKAAEPPVPATLRG